MEPGSTAASGISAGLPFRRRVHAIRALSAHVLHTGPNDTSRDPYESELAAGSEFIAMASFLKRDLTANRALKAKLAAGKVVSLIHSSHSSPSLVEKLGEYGFDMTLIDCEHGSGGPARVEEMARAASLQGIISILRPPAAILWMITQYLECGVDGFMVPLVADRAGDGRSTAILRTIRSPGPLPDSHDRDPGGGQ